MDVGGIAATTTAVLHVGFFVLETVLFPRDTKVQRRFGARSPAEVQALTVALGNQGFYNLCMAAMVVYGLYVRGGADGRLLARAVCASLAGCGGYLAFSKPAMFAGALVQAIPALAAVYFL
jgi:uncharacterized membrane protein